MTQTTSMELPSARAVLDCSGLAALERFDAWSDAVNRSFVPLSAHAPDRDSRQAFTGGLVSQGFANTMVSAVSGSAVRVSRTGTEIAHSDPGHIKLGLQLRGTASSRRTAATPALAPGDFALYDTTRPYTLDFDASFRMFVVMFPVESLRLDHDRSRAVTAARFSGRQGLGAIMSRFLGAMSEQLDSDALAGSIELSDAVFDLLTATLAERTQWSDVSDERARRRALLAQVEAYIEAHLGDPGLTVSHVAEVHHVSLRYLQKLFEEREQTASGVIRQRRLERSRRDLGDPGLADQQIATVGARWGFADAAAYARAFRQEFGVSPSEYRTVSHPH